MKPESTAESHASNFTRRRAFTTTQVFAGLLALLLIWFAGRIFLMGFGGVLLAVFLYTLATWLSRVTPLSYGWSLAAVVVVIVALASGTFVLIGSRVVVQANEFSEAVPRSLKQIRSYVQEYQFGEWILEQSPDWGKAIAQGNLPSRITDLASSIIDLLVAVVIMMFVGLYCAAEPNVYIEGVLHLVPLDRRHRAREVLAALGYNLRWWVLGQMFAMICVGLITGIALWMVGAPLALVLGLLAALLEIVPSVGPVLWLLPAVLVSLTQSESQVIDVVLIYAVTHAIESYLLIPLVQRRAVFLPPTISVLAVVLFGLLAGVLGLVVAAPLAVVAMLLVKMLYVEDRLGDHTVKVAGEPRC